MAWGNDTGELDLGFSQQMICSGLNAFFPLSYSLFPVKVSITRRCRSRGSRQQAVIGIRRMR